MSNTFNNFKIAYTTEGGREIYFAREIVGVVGSVQNVIVEDSSEARVFKSKDDAWLHAGMIQANEEWRKMLQDRGVVVIEPHIVEDVITYNITYNTIRHRLHI